MSTDRNIRQFLGRPFVILLLCSSGRLAYAQDEIVPAADAPPPKSTEESLKAFRVPDGLAVELVAAEPLLSEPTGMCFDARGRMFVCELHGYNRDGYYDIVELNKQGVSVLLVEQNARMALKVAHRGYVLETGRITFTDKADVLLHDPRIREAYLGE